MECDVQANVFVGRNTSSLRRDGEVLSIGSFLPCKLDGDVTEVSNLKLFGKSTSSHHWSESDHFFHELDLDAMRHAVNGEQLSTLVVLNVEHDVVPEVRHS